MAQLIEVVLDIRSNMYKCSYDGTYKYKLPFPYEPPVPIRKIANLVSVPVVGNYIRIDNIEYYVEKVTHSEATVTLKIIEEK